MSSLATHREHPWPPVVLNRRHPNERDVSFSVFSVDLPPMAGESETYIPVSAPLSDEVVGAACDRFEQALKDEGFDQFEFPESFMREALQAAIEQVGGTK